MFNLDVQLFYFINRLAGKSQIADLIFSFFAVGLIYILLAGFIVLVFAKSDYSYMRIRFLDFFHRNLYLDKIKINYYLFFTGVFSSVLSYAISQIISWIYFRPRPFIDLEGVVKLISKSGLDKSFPSDHTILAFTIAFSVFYFYKRAGVFFLIGAFLVAISRIYVGVHYPLDIVGGIVLSYVVSYIVYRYLKRFYK